MGWDNQGRYYSRSKREGGRVVRQYVGKGEFAAICARSDVAARESRADDLSRRQKAQAEGEEALAWLWWYCGAVENILRGHLTAAGFHQHDRGQWRRERGRAVTTEVQRAARAEIERRANQRAEAAQEAGRELAIRQAAVPETKEERVALIRAAANGEQPLEAAALACIQKHPAEAIIGWGNPRNPCLNLTSPSKDTSRGRVLRAVIGAEYDFHLKQVAGDNPTPLENLLAERITVLRMQITHFEQVYETRLGEGLSAEMSEFHMKRIERMTKMYLRAIESLARVRRLQLPAVQVNIGEKQVNIAGGLRKARAAMEAREAMEAKESGE